MRIQLLMLFMLVFAAAHAQRPQKPWNQGIGLRIGAPLGITYKKYIGKLRAAELNVGSASPFWNRAYYENSFSDYSQFDSYRYLSHDVESTFYLQGRYLSHYNIPVEGIEGNLNWYWGAGGLLKLAKVNYRYNDPTLIPSIQTDVRTDFDFGPEVILGMEYHLEDLPFSAFGEGSLALEVLDRPGSVRTFGALGIRYNFR